MNQPTEGYREIAQFAGLPDDSRRREEMLWVARRLSGQYDLCAALLWLYDEENEQFHLDHYEPMEADRRLARLSLRCDRATAHDREHIEGVGVVTANSDRVNRWLDGQTLGDHRKPFHVKPTRGGAGYLEIVTATPLEPEAIDLLTGSPR